MASLSDAPGAENSARPRTGKPVLASATVLAVPGIAVVALAVALAGTSVEHAMRKHSRPRPAVEHSMRGTQTTTAPSTATGATATVAKRPAAPARTRSKPVAPIARAHRHDATPTRPHQPAPVHHGDRQPQTVDQFNLTPRSQPNTQGVPPSGYDGGSTSGSSTQQTSGDWSSSGDGNGNGNGKQPGSKDHGGGGDGGTW
jgi:uncharacterized membrane protein YgcG